MHTKVAARLCILPASHKYVKEGASHDEEMGKGIHGRKHNVPSTASTSNVVLAPGFCWQMYVNEHMRMEG
jgi:hypothetical protein